MAEKQIMYRFVHSQSLMQPIVAFASMPHNGGYKVLLAIEWS
jgi:hypothetical protein